MKIEKIITALYFTIALVSCTEINSNVPNTIKRAFNKKFSNAKNVTWEKENEDEWEAEFKLNGKQYSANFSFNGDWKETEYEINFDDAPQEIKSILNKNFMDYQIEEVTIIETSLDKYYEFEIEVKKEKIEVLINENSGVITKIKEEEES